MNVDEAVAKALEAASNAKSANYSRYDPDYGWPEEGGYMDECEESINQLVEAVKHLATAVQRLEMTTASRSHLDVRGLS